MFAFILGALILLAALSILLPAAGDPTIIGPQDANLLLQASVTKTATFNSASLDLGSGWAPGGAGEPMQVQVNYSAGDFVTGDESYKFRLEESSDNSTFTACSADYVAPVTLAAPAGGLAFGATIAKRYVRLVATLAGTTPSITYLAYLQPNTVA